MRGWPDTLPTFSLPDYRFSPVDQTQRTDMERGAKKTRRITFAKQDMLDVSVKFDDAEMAAFKAWYYDEPWSLTGDSDNVTAWSLTNVTVTPDATVGPDNVLVDRVLETTTNSNHHIRFFPGAAILDNQDAVFQATLKAAGRTLVRVAMTDRAGTLGFATIDLATGLVTGSSGLASAVATVRGGGWHRLSIKMNVASGATTAAFRVQALDSGGAASYVGDVTKGFDICEVNGRVATGYDLFVRTDSAGNALGAAGGSGWFFITVADGGGVKFAEARFSEVFSANALPGFNWQVSMKLERRNG